MNELLIFGGTQCKQCQAISKRSGERCMAPAMIGKNVCRMHGGKSTGPQTDAGIKRCKLAKTIHGKDTRLSREEIKEKLRLLRDLEDLGFSLGLMRGKRTRGRKYKF